ncbi:Vmc-like lipoprotein signal peptide domain-containing protein [Spiroplasma eriocheiris]|uniref:Lipoprotein n=1 Tax=Spiroplasma eriocheiris TaxID=315358 RepID=A0A0H3XMV4_9MOLU|nr:hypothetical protein [Spiroplasma eriocheiris]AHF57952.1 hypothetical protein SPE_0830 [Spiroplasma eriocheiris CCTCC M 207170]AKM54392.1 hypothetical protein SERIO_v1c08320 [Spiroplasma eriocheiris]
MKKLIAILSTLMITFGTSALAVSCSTTSSSHSSLPTPQPKPNPDPVENEKEYDSVINALDHHQFGSVYTGPLGGFYVGESLTNIINTILNAVGDELDKLIYRNGEEFDYMSLKLTQANLKYNNQIATEFIFLTAGVYSLFASFQYHDKFSNPIKFNIPIIDPMDAAIYRGLQPFARNAKLVVEQNNFNVQELEEVFLKTNYVKYNLSNESVFPAFIYNNSKFSLIRMQINGQNITNELFKTPGLYKITISFRYGNYTTDGPSPLYWYLDLTVVPANTSYFTNFLYNPNDLENKIKIADYREINNLTRVNYQDLKKILSRVMGKLAVQQWGFPTQYDYEIYNDKKGTSFGSETFDLTLPVQRDFYFKIYGTSKLNDQCQSSIFKITLPLVYQE